MLNSSGQVKKNSEGIDEIKNGQSHIITSLTPTIERSEFLNFTSSYVDTSLVIFSREGNEKYTQ